MAIDKLVDDLIAVEFGDYANDVRRRSQEARCRELKSVTSHELWLKPGVRFDEWRFEPLTRAKSAFDAAEARTAQRAADALKLLRDIAAMPGEDASEYAREEV